MGQQMTDALKTAKTIQQEMVQWENRLETMKQDYGNLKRQNDILQEEIDKKRTDYATYIAEREKQLRDGFDKVAEDRKSLDAKWEEFKELLDAHQKEKMAIGQQRMDLEREKSVFSGQKQLVNDFIQAVRRAYSLIAE